MKMKKSLRDRILNRLTVGDKVQVEFGHAGKGAFKLYFDESFIADDLEQWKDELLDWFYDKFYDQIDDLEFFGDSYEVEFYLDDSELNVHVIAEQSSDWCASGVHFQDGFVTEPLIELICRYTDLDADWLYENPEVVDFSFSYDGSTFQELKICINEDLLSLTNEDRLLLIKILTDEMNNWFYRERPTITTDFGDDKIEISDCDSLDFFVEIDEETDE